MAPTKKASGSGKTRSSSSDVSLKKVKGENFYRNAKQVGRLKMLNGRNRKILGEMSEHDRKELDREDEVYDSDPRFVFVT